MKIAYCLFRDQFQHIKPVEQWCHNKVRFIYDDVWNPESIINVKPDIVIGINEYHLKIAECYKVANELGIPTLTIQDGVLEWRYLFENPMFSGSEFGVPLHFPIIADKYACIGPWWKSLIAAMGNVEKVELTGMPKMDLLENHSIPFARKSVLPKKILVMTAAKPWFTDKQKDIVFRMLADLKSYFEKRDDIETVWRVTKDLDKDLRVKGAFIQKESIELATQLNACDAVISTTSTAMIETLLMGKPLAKIDYFNSPPLFPTVWSITAQNHIEDTINSLLAPTPEQCYWQEVFKNQVLSPIGFGAIKVGELILKMIHFKEANPFKMLPVNMLDDNYELPESNRITAELLYPKRQSLKTHDFEWLRRRLIRLERENNLLQEEVSQRKIGSLLLKLYNKIKTKL